MKTQVNPFIIFFFSLFYATILSPQFSKGLSIKFLDMLEQQVHNLCGFLRQ